MSEQNIFLVKLFWVGIGMACGVIGWIFDPANWPNYMAWIAMFGLCAPYEGR